jgi:hypothetical protein
MLSLSLYKFDNLGDERRRPIVQSITKERFITNSLGGERRPIDQLATKKMFSAVSNWKALSLNGILGVESRPIDQSATKERSRTNSWNVLSLHGIQMRGDQSFISTTKERYSTNNWKLHGILGCERLPINQPATKERSRTTNNSNLSLPTLHPRREEATNQSNQP